MSSKTDKEIIRQYVESARKKINMFKLFVLAGTLLLVALILFSRQNPLIDFLFLIYIVLFFLFRTYLTTVVLKCPVCHKRFRNLFLFSIRKSYIYIPDYCPNCYTDLKPDK